ncbi:MAG: hypothetical protein ABIJ35_01160 [Acidobacteriota bacterium]
MINQLFSMPYLINRDDEGQITLCLVTIDAMGITDLEGHKIIK